MSRYNKTNWKTGDKITADKLNKIEDGIEAMEFMVAEVEGEVDEFERNLNTDVQQFKIDTNAAMTAHKNEVSEVVESVNTQLAHNMNEENYISRGGIDKKVVYKKDGILNIFTEKTSNSKEYIQFKMQEGVGTTNISEGVNYEFLRCTRVYNIVDLFLLKTTPSTFSEGVETIVLPYCPIPTTKTDIECYYNPNKSIGDYIEYTTNTTSNTLNIFYYASSGSSSDVNISIDGIVVLENISFVGEGEFKTLQIPTTVGTHTVRIETNVRKNIYIAGVNKTDIKDFKGADFDKLVYVDDIENRYVKVDGSMDYALLQKDNGLWCGSYHGGEVRKDLKIYIDGKEKTVNNNEVLICDTVEILQETKLVDNINTFSRQIFIHNGEIELQVNFKCDTPILLTDLFTNMSTTSDTFTEVIYPTYEKVPEDGKVYFDNGCNYIIQRNPNTNQKAITILNNKKVNNSLPYIKNMANTYNKVYNANIRSDEGELFEQGSYRTVHIFD